MVRTVNQLAEAVSGRVEGDGTLSIESAATLTQAVSGQVSFVSNPKYESLLGSTAASAVVVGEHTPGANGLTLIRTADPYYAFMQIVVLLHGHRTHPATGISDRASIAPTAQLGEQIDVHDYAVVMDGAQIGDNTRIYPHCCIGPGAVIGSDCILYPNVTVYDDCRIGDRVILHSGCVIGQDGFGFATHGGAHHKIPQIGTVVLGDDVELGANCAIERGALGDTVIGTGTKLSDSVVIGHGTRIGEHCLLVAQVGIAGSVEVGNYTVFGGQVGVVGHIRIGNGVQVAAQSAIVGDVPDGAKVAGVPAVEINQAKRAHLLVNRLPEFREKLRELERSVRGIIKGK